RRIAPNPSRLTCKSPPMLKVELSLGDAAAKNVAALPAKSDAPPARVARRNTRRVMPLTRVSLMPKYSLSINRKVTSGDAVTSCDRVGTFLFWRGGSGMKHRTSRALDQGLKPICGFGGC